MATKAEIRRMVKRLEASRNVVTRERDLLQGLMDEIEQHFDCCERASYALKEAVGALSELL